MSAAKSLQRRSSQAFEIFDVRPRSRSPSVNPFREQSPTSGRQDVTQPMQVPMDDEDSDSDSVESDVSVVRIVSSDPRAAARAAAILKMVR